MLAGGAAAMSDQLLGLSYCNGSLCSLGRAVQAFAWISWIALTLLLVLVIVLAVVSLRSKTNESIWTKPLEVHSTKSAQANAHPGSHTHTQPQSQAQTTANPSTQSTKAHPEMSAV